MSSGGPSALLASVEPVERDVRRWWALAVAALLLRFVIMPYGGYPTDIGTFKAWSQALVERGPMGFYGQGFADYLPGYLYILWLIGELHQIVRFSDQAHLFVLKLPAAISDVVTAWVIFALARRFGSRWALPLAASYLLNPGIVFTSAYWGQADAVGAAFALAGVATLGRASPIFPAALLTVAALIKPQTAPVMIPAGLYLLRALARPPEGAPRWDLIASAAAAGMLTLVVVILPFGLNLPRLAGLLRSSLDVYPYGSVVAFNMWGTLQGFWVSDQIRWLGVPLYVAGATAAAVALTAVAAWTWPRPSSRAVVLAAAVALLATFVLPTRIHERYLLPAVPFFAVAAATDRRMAGVYAGLSLVFALNLLYAYTRPYVGTFLLPGWVETTVFSTGAVRAWSALGALLLPAAFYLLFTSREEVRHGDAAAGSGERDDVVI
jgi:Gpi18-like mannosyltransferase